MYVLADIEGMTSVEVRRCWAWGDHTSILDRFLSCAAGDTLVVNSRRAPSKSGGDGV